MKLSFLPFLLVPLGITAIGIGNALLQPAGGWEGAIVGILISFCVMALLLNGIFLAVNLKWLKWKLNWWKNLIIAVVLYVAGVWLFSTLIRIIELNG